MSTTTIQERAALMSRAFEVRTRDSGGEFVALRDDSPDWMTHVVRAAHEDGQKLPDDWTYAAVRDCVDMIAEGADPDDDAPEPDVYTHDLARWAVGHIDAIDEVIGEFGPFESYWHLLTAAQENALRGVMGAVSRALELVDDDETDDAES